MALITSDCDAMRSPEHEMAPITSDCPPLQAFNRWSTKIDEQVACSCNSYGEPVLQL